MEHCIYYVRSGRNEELRYSLRSLHVNGPKDIRLTIVGDPPDWVDRSLVEVLPGNSHNNPYKNSLENITIASHHEPGNYYIFNDDFFLLKPWPDPFPVWYWRTIEEHMSSAMGDPRSKPRKLLFQRTLNYLRSLGIEHPNHYELHIPMKINGTSMLRILDEAEEYINIDNPPIWRTLYGNLASTGTHVQRADVKYHLNSMIPEGVDFLSTDERTFRNTIQMVNHFSEKSPWER